MKLTSLLQIFIFLLCTPALVFAQDEEDQVQENGTSLDYEYRVRTTHIQDSIYILEGKGGNVAVQIGKDGVLVVDSQFEASAPHILNAILRLSTQNVRLLINTHHHGDHIGGNAVLKDMGAIAIAQRNNRNRIMEDLMKQERQMMEDSLNVLMEQFRNKGASEEEVERMAKEASADIEINISENPLAQNITFGENMTLYYNEDNIVLTHVHNAHTDGDAIVYFTKANVMHTGDAFISGKYPFIDLENGGTTAGYMEGLSKIIMMADDDVKIIPGHGKLATLDDVKYTQRMLEFLTSRIEFYYLSGKTLEQILAEREFTKEFDDKGFGNGFINREKIITTLYQDVERKYKGKRSKN